MEARSTSGAVPARPAADGDPLRRRGVDAYVAELLGTLILVFFIGTIYTYTSEAAFNVTDWAVIGLVHFLVLAILIQTLGHASGAHLNPAVTVTLAALRRIGPVDAAIYVLLQLVGALLGTLLVKVLLNTEGDPVGYGAPELSALIEGKALAGFLAELIGTFVLMWTIMALVVHRRAARSWAGWAVGAAFGAAVMTIGPMTTGAFNPARAFGPSLIGQGEPAGEFLVAYVLGPLVGALLAGTIYAALMMRPEDLDDDAPVAVAAPRTGEEETLVELPPGVDAPGGTGERTPGS